MRYESFRPATTQSQLQAMETANLQIKDVECYATVQGFAAFEPFETKELGKFMLVTTRSGKIRLAVNGRLAGELPGRKRVMVARELMERKLG